MDFHFIYEKIKCMFVFWGRELEAKPEFLDHLNGVVENAVME